MKTISTLVNGKISKKGIKNTADWKKRTAARAIILDNQNKIPLLWSNKYLFYKIPGGGIENGENIIKALKREIMEELGIKIKNIKPLGEIKEYHTKNKYYQISYCFTAKVKKKVKNPKYTENEKSAEMELKWLTKHEALEAMKNNIPKEQDYKSIQLRDYLFMKRALK